MDLCEFKTSQSDIVRPPFCFYVFESRFIISLGRFFISSWKVLGIGNSMQYNLCKKKTKKHVSCAMIPELVGKPLF